MDMHEEGHALEVKVRAIVDALPQRSFLRNYVLYASGLTDANAAYHLGAGLALLTQIAPDDLHVRLGNRLYGNLYVLLIGVSTDSRKTSAVKIAREVMEEAIPGRVSGNPGSYEGLYDSLAKQNRQLIAYEEFGHFMAETRNSYMSKIKTGYANIYDCSPLDRKLSTAGTTAKNAKVYPPVQKPRLSLLCACTPGFLSRFSEPVDWTDGFFARFLSFQAVRSRHYVTTPPDWREMRDWLINRIRQLNAVQVPVDTTCEEPTGEARYVMEQWVKYQSEMYQTRRTSKTAGAIGRSQALVEKVAMLLHLEQEMVQGPVWRFDANLLRIAGCIVRLHLEGVLSLGDILGGTTDMNDRQAVLQSLSETPKSIGQLSNEAYLLRRRTMEILETLKDQGLVTTSHRQREEDNAVEEVYSRKMAKVYHLDDYRPAPVDPPAVSPPTDPPTER